MEDKEYLMTEMTKKAKSTAAKLYKEKKGVIENKLTAFFEKDALFAVNVSKELIQIAKDSVKGKSENQKQFIALCNAVIDRCNKSLEDGNVSESERSEILKLINQTLQMANESNKQYQKDKKQIALAAIAAIGAVAVAIVKLPKR